MYAIIDLETTGYRNSANRITEIAILIHDGEKVVDTFQSLVNPECRIPPFIQTLTGIDDTMVSGAPKFYELAERVHRMTEGMVFVAHNVSFDYNTLRKEYASLGFDYRRERLCTVRLSKKIFPGMKSYSLGNICAHMGIRIEGRHRAFGDAEATTVLFERMLAEDPEDHIGASLKRRKKRAFIPPDIDLATIESLPERPGVYYFKDGKGKVIYVGKAKDIKARILGHFHSQERKERLMHPNIRSITYTETGNELIALLLENAEIKRIFPRYNSAQKRKPQSWGIFHYTDQKGIIHLGYAQGKQLKQSDIRFYTISRCRSFLETLVEEFELCPAYCQLQSSKGSCFHRSLKQCRGICEEKESIHAYNERVQEAILSMNGLQGSFVLPVPGRRQDEYGFVYVERGLYMGYGYLAEHPMHAALSSLGKALMPQVDDADAQRILRGFMKRPDLDFREIDRPLESEGQQVLSLF